MSSAVEAELAAIFLTSKDMLPLHQTLVEMEWTQGQSPIQTDNSTAMGVTNNNISQKRTNSTEMIFHWLRFPAWSRDNSDSTGALALKTWEIIAQSITRHYIIFLTGQHIPDKLQ